MLFINSANKSQAERIITDLNALLAVETQALESLPLISPDTHYMEKMDAGPYGAENIGNYWVRAKLSDGQPGPIVAVAKVGFERAVNDSLLRKVASYIDMGDFIAKSSIQIINIKQLLAFEKKKSLKKKSKSKVRPSGDNKDDLFTDFLTDFSGKLEIDGDDLAFSTKQKKKPKKKERKTQGQDISDRVAVIQDLNATYHYSVPEHLIEHTDDDVVVSMIHFVESRKEASLQNLDLAKLLFLACLLDIQDLKADGIILSGHGPVIVDGADNIFSRLHKLKDDVVDISAVRPLFLDTYTEYSAIMQPDVITEFKKFIDNINIMIFSTQLDGLLCELSKMLYTSDALPFSHQPLDSSSPSEQVQTEKIKLPEPTLFLRIPFSEIPSVVCKRLPIIQENIKLLKDSSEVNILDLIACLDSRLAAHIKSWQMTEDMIKQDEGSFDPQLSRHMFNQTPLQLTLSDRSPSSHNTSALLVSILAKIGELSEYIDHEGVIKTQDRDKTCVATTLELCSLINQLDRTSISHVQYAPLHHEKDLRRIAVELDKAITSLEKSKEVTNIIIKQMLEGPRLILHDLLNKKEERSTAGADSFRSSVVSTLRASFRISGSPLMFVGDRKIFSSSFGRVVESRNASPELPQAAAAVFGGIESERVVTGDTDQQQSTSSQVLVPVLRSSMVSRSCSPARSVNPIALQLISHSHSAPPSLNSTPERKSAFKVVKRG